MKTSNLYAQLELLPPDAVTPQTGKPAASKSIWRGVQRTWGQAGNALWRYLCGSQEPRISRKYDSAGQRYFQVYDPVDQQNYNFGSETELRVWLEQRYYQ